MHSLSEKISALLAAWDSQKTLCETPKCMKNGRRFTGAVFASGMRRPEIPFTDWEMRFLSSLSDRVSKYGFDISMSPKQLEVIDRLLAEKLPDALRPPGADSPKG